MAFYDTVWYANSAGYTAVATRPQNTAVVAGQLVRQFTAPAVGNERVFVCVVAGTTANTTDATWTITRGAKVVDGTATWVECTGASAVNGDTTNTVTWTQGRAISAAPQTGTIIKRNNGVSYQIMTSVGGNTGASEPAFSDTAGVTTTDSTVTWTSLGPVGNFTGGQAPHARLNNVFAVNWFVAGNTIYVGDNHAETQATVITYSIPSGQMAKILCHNHSGSYPPASGDLTTGATITTTSTATININGQGSFYFYGMTFSAGTTIASGSAITIGASAIANTQNWYYFDNCSLRIGGTSAASTIGLGTTTSIWNIVIFNNTTVRFVHTGQLLQLVMCDFTWRNTGQILASGSLIPVTLFLTAGSGNFDSVTLEALDLSQFTGTLFSNSVGASVGNVTCKDCKLNASVTVANLINTGITVQFIRSDSSATAYKSARYQFEGAETTETSITRVGGASDPTGQAQSRKVVSTANAQWLRPFQCEPYAIWNAATGANVTVTVCGTVNAGTLPNNDDIWLECEYLGTSGFPVGTIITSTKASLLAVNAAVSSDGSTWNGGGSGAGWSPFKLTTTLSAPQPGMAGYIHARVRVGKASTTYYLDPMVTLT